MGNIHQAGVKKDDHGGGDNQQLQVVSVLELQAGVVEDQPQPLGGWHAVEATSMLENCKANSTATDGGTGSRIDILGPATEQNIPKPSDPPHPCPPPQSLPEGVQSVLKTSRVRYDNPSFTTLIKFSLLPPASSKVILICYMHG
uniref:Uncharacterized protein n=1 Tax=Triticum urartu TaxID=4572 RepID=A0A8R7TN68_TRIUA